MTSTLCPHDTTFLHPGVISGPNMPHIGYQDQPASLPICSPEDPPCHLHVADFAGTPAVPVLRFDSNHPDDILDFIYGGTVGSDVSNVTSAGTTTYSDVIHRAFAGTGCPCVKVHFANIFHHFDASIPHRPRIIPRLVHTAVAVVISLSQHDQMSLVLALWASFDDADLIDPAAVNGDTGAPDYIFRRAGISLQLLISLQKVTSPDPYTTICATTSEQAATFGGSS